MSERSTWDTIRKRLAPVAFLIALLVLATQTCGSELAEVEVVFELGNARGDVSQVHADVYRGDSSESLAYFDGAPGPRMVWTMQLDPGDYRIGFRVTMRDGSVRSFERAIVAESNAVIRLNLEHSLKN